jgi:hypothetical protein
MKAPALDDWGMGGVLQGTLRACERIKPGGILARVRDTSMARERKPSEKGPGGLPAVTSISVAGFKSIGDEQTIEVRPLTLLAGANSSGKSSMMQPLLLLKQTLEAPFDPGPLLLNGPNAKFTSIGQFLPVGSASRKPTWTVVGIGISGGSRFAVGLRPEKSRQPEKGRYKIDLEFNEYEYEVKFIGFGHPRRMKIISILFVMSWERGLSPRKSVYFPCRSSK